LHKKILLSLLICCTLISTPFTGLTFAAKIPQVNVNGTLLSFNKPPQTLSITQELYVEMRPLLAKLGFSISWQQATSSIIAVKQDKTFTFQLGSYTFMFNGVQHSLNAPVGKVGSYTFFTPQSIADLLGVDILWNPYSLMLHVKTNFPAYIQDELASGRLSYQGSPVPADLSGEGALYWGDELFYKGEFKDGKLAGFGTLYQDEKIIYQGTFAKNLPDGSGTYFFPNGDTYVGGFKSGLRDGNGTLRFANGLIGYDGNWKNGIKGGIGRLVNEKGNQIYSGDIIEGKRNGYGIAYNENGKKTYRGNWANNLKEGLGESFDPGSGRIEYNGKWSNDLKNVTGTTYSYSKGNFYTFDSVGNVTQIEEKDFLDISETSYNAGVAVSTKPLLHYAGSLDEEGMPHGKGDIGYPTVDFTTKVGVLQDSQYFYSGDFYHSS
jgi:hypothetical protein